MGVNGTGTNAFQIQKRCPHCLKVVFQKDRRTGKVMFLDPQWKVPQHMIEEVYGSSGESTVPSTPERFSGITTPGASSSELEGSSPPPPSPSKSRRTKKTVTKEPWEMEPEEADYQEFLAWKRFQEMRKQEKSSSSADGKRM
eukprot:s5960_g2.t1